MPSFLAISTYSVHRCVSHSIKWESHKWCSLYSADYKKQIFFFIPVVFRAELKSVDALEIHKLIFWKMLIFQAWPNICDNNMRASASVRNNCEEIRFLDAFRRGFILFLAKLMVFSKLLFFQNWNFVCNPDHLKGSVFKNHGLILADYMAHHFRRLNTRSFCFLIRCFENNIQTTFAASKSNNTFESEIRMTAFFLSPCTFTYNQLLFSRIRALIKPQNVHQICHTQRKREYAIQFLPHGMSRATIKSRIWLSNGLLSFNKR